MFFVPSFAQGKPLEKVGRKTRGAKADKAMPARLPEVREALEQRLGGYNT